MLYNTHGGNTSLIDVMARDLRAEFGLRTFALHGSGGIFVRRPRAAGTRLRLSRGRSGNGFLLASVPELVDRSAYTVNYIADIAKPELLLPENAPATFAWLTRDIAPSGVMGDPRPATAENGARWLDEAATRLAAALEAMFRFPDPPTRHESSAAAGSIAAMACASNAACAAACPTASSWFPIITIRRSPGPHPTLLMRQPYGRDIASTVVYAHPVWFARHGYNVVIQDVRGRGDSDGDFYPFRHEGARRRGDHRVAAHAPRIERPHRHVRILLSGHDAACSPPPSSPKAWCASRRA